MLALLRDPQIQSIINPPNVPVHWQSDLKRLEEGDMSLTRHSAGENSIKAFQRLLIFLGYSTSASGTYAIDGDFGRGTNRAVAQFEFEHGIANTSITRNVLAYDCTWQTASRLITAIPDVRLTFNTLERMLEAARQAIDTNAVSCGDFDEAIFQLNALYYRELLTCREINERYGAAAENAANVLRLHRNINIQPEWILSIMRQETAGVVRPKFEQHWLTKLAKQNPSADLQELRYQATSFGLGQVMGFNFKRIGASSAKALYTLPLEEQVISIARFLTLSSRVRPVVGGVNPSDEDFRTVARYYNGSGFAAHHYDESLARWFREFRMLRG